VKILYSLDELMPNCLARAKEVAQVRVIQLDTDTAIGLVDLRTCVLNITYSRWVHENKDMIVQI